jgi:hypothetical protein
MFAFHVEPNFAGKQVFFKPVAETSSSKQRFSALIARHQDAWQVAASGQRGGLAPWRKASYTPTSEL